MKRSRVSLEDVPVEVETRPAPASGSVVLFNETHQSIQCHTVQGNTVVTFEPKSRTTLGESELSEDMLRQIRLGHLRREHPVME